MSVKKYHSTLLGETMKSEFVLYSDYKQLERQNAELQDEINVLKVGISNRDIIYKRVTDEYAKLQDKKAELVEALKQSKMAMLSHNEHNPECDCDFKGSLIYLDKALAAQKVQP